MFSFFKKFFLDPKKNPKHIAVIMDGNGRWAQRNNLPRIEGHRRGSQTANRMIKECQRLGLDQLTLYCLSHENWKRPAEELEFLMHLLQQFMIESRGEMIERKIRLSIIGRRDKLPDEVQAEMDKSIEMTSQFEDFCLCLAINYGSRQEILDAVKKIASETSRGQLAIDDIDESSISERLYTAGMPDPDLLIRTAGEMRLSNYLLWQIAYADLYFCPKLWPDFKEEEMQKALQAYAGRQRRFGQTDDQIAARAAQQ